MLTFLIVSVSIILLLKLFFVLTCSYCKSKVCLVGKTALVTGGSYGIGYHIVLGLASRGCKVIIADKIVDSSIKEALVRETHNPNISIKYVDLASFTSVRKFAEELKKSEEKLDILINNAGIGKSSEDPTEDGLNMTMQVNYFSGFLLTHLLIDLLKKSSSGRIIFTSSGLSTINTVTMGRILSDKISAGTDLPFAPYCDSKFCVIVAAHILAEKLEKYGITSNSFHPGIVKTGLFQKSLKDSKLTEKCIAIFGETFALLLGKTADEGAQTAIYLACADEIKDVTGKFFGEASPTFKPWNASDSELCKAIWECSERAVKLTPTEKLD